jgi:translation initiation factor 2 alpha subunit (eIF-2alpha)
MMDDKTRLELLYTAVPCDDEQKAKKGVKMTEEERNEWQEELRMEAMEERADDRRYANRSAEEILEDIEQEMSDKFGETLEIIYNAIRNELSDYGLEHATNDMFENIIRDNTQYISSARGTIRFLRQQNAAIVAELQAYRNDV